MYFEQGCVKSTLNVATCAKLLQDKEKRIKLNPMMNVDANQAYPTYMGILSQHYTVLLQIFIVKSFVIFVFT